MHGRLLNFWTKIVYASRSRRGQLEAGARGKWILENNDCGASGHWKSMQAARNSWGKLVQIMQKMLTNMLKNDAKYQNNWPQGLPNRFPRAPKSTSGPSETPFWGNTAAKTAQKELRPNILVPKVWFWLAFWSPKIVENPPHRLSVFGVSEQQNHNIWIN